VTRTVLVTRAAKQGAATAMRLRQRGYDVVVAPLVRIERLPATIPPAPQAILVTSSNGADALADGSGGRLVPILAVGQATADALRHAGFTDVVSADGDAQALAALALQRLDPARGPVIHVRGAEIRYSPLDPLREAGFETGEAILYRTVAIRTLPDTVVRCDTALIYSPGSARRLREAMPDPAPRLDIVAISAAALVPLHTAPFAASLHAAPHPSQAGMMQVLDAFPNNPGIETGPHN